MAPIAEATPTARAGISLLAALSSAGEEGVEEAAELEEEAMAPEATEK